MILHTVEVNLRLVLLVMLLIFMNLVVIIVAQDCPDLSEIANNQSVSYSATPHMDQSTATINCSAEPFIFLPVPFSVATCRAGSWNIVPRCMDPESYLTRRGISNCNSGCRHNSLTYSAMFMPSYCAAGNYWSGDFNGDSYCDNMCYFSNGTIQVMHLDSLTRTYVEAFGTSGGLGLYPSTFCETETNVLESDVNRDGISDLICELNHYEDFTDTLVLWGKETSGLERLTSPSRMYLDKNEYMCTSPYPRKLLYQHAIKCSIPNQMKFGRFCFLGTGNATFSRDENPCSALGMTYPFIEDANDLYWFNRAREYYGMRSDGTWLSARRQPGGQFKYNQSTVNYLPWKSNHPTATDDCVMVDNYTASEILSVNCSTKQRQLCQAPTADTSMCGDLVVANATVQYSLWSRPEQSTAKVMCNIHFELSPESTDGIVTCQYYFRWNRQITCRIQCDPIVVQNGFFNFNEVTRTGATTCDAGFQLRGSTGPVQCNDPGNWPGAMQPVCELMQSRCQFLIYNGKTLSVFGNDQKVSAFTVATVGQCMWKCCNDLRCLTAWYDEHSLVCELFEVNSKLMESLSAPINIKLIVFRS